MFQLLEAHLLVVHHLRHLRLVYRLLVVLSV
jgi:hypothetical protein